MKHARTGITVLNNKIMSATLKKRFEIENEQFDLIATHMRALFRDILDDGKLELEKYFSADSVAFIKKLSPKTLTALFKMINVFKGESDED